MDTSPRPRVRFSATGFGSFRGVEQNPSAELISRLARRVDAGGAPTLRAAVVSEVSVEGADALLARLCEDVREDAAGGAGGAGGASFDVLLHFGVAAGSKVFAIESRAPNEKDFRVPDERGLQPRGEPVDAELPLAAWRRSALDTAALAAELAARGWNATESQNPGRFLCAYIYFQSLTASASMNATFSGASARARRCVSLFVHVPLHSVSDADAQERFALELMALIEEQLRARPPQPDAPPAADEQAPAPAGVTAADTAEDAALLAAKSGDVAAVGAAVPSAPPVAPVAPAVLAAPAAPAAPTAPAPAAAPTPSPLELTLIELGFDSRLVSTAVGRLGERASVEAAVDLIEALQSAPSPAPAPATAPLAAAASSAVSSAASWLSANLFQPTDSLLRSAAAAAVAAAPSLLLQRVKLVLVVRSDLDMGKGKVAAQCSHAALKALRRLQQGGAGDGADAARLRALRAAWEGSGEKIVVVRGDGGLEQLEALSDQAQRKGLLASVIRDAGRTQVEPGSLTVLAVGPDEEDRVDDVTGHLKLLS